MTGKAFFNHLRFFNKTPRIKYLWCGLWYVYPFLAESVWTGAGWLQRGDRGGAVGVSDAPNRVPVLGGLHQHRGRGGGRGGPAAALPLRVLAAGKSGLMGIRPNPSNPINWISSRSQQAYHVTDAALGYFSPKQSHSLSILRLQSCWELTNHGIVNIGKRHFAPCQLIK